MANAKPVRVIPYAPFDQRNIGGLNSVDYHLLPGSPPSLAGNTATQGADALNVYLEKQGDHYRAIKRTGTAQLWNFIPAGGTSSPPKGLTVFNGTPFAVVEDDSAGDVLIFPAGQPNSATNGAAYTAAPTAAWAPRAAMVVLNANNGTYVIGGNNSSTNITDVWYSVDTSTWVLVSGGVPFGNRVAFGGCVFNGTMYLFGGYAVSGVTPTGAQSDVWSSTDGNNWTQITTTAPWGPRSSMNVVSTPNGIFILGGANAGGGVLADVWFSPDGVNWNQVQTIGSKWTGRYAASSWWFNNTLFYGGGHSNALIGNNDVWSSTNGGASWTQLTAAAWATGVNNASTCVYNNKLWIFGGTTNALGTTANIYSSPTGVTWTFVGSLPQGAVSAPGIAIQRTPPPGQYNTIWVMGGVTAGSVYNNNVYYGTLNTSLTNQYALSPSTPNFTTTLYDFASYNNTTQLFFKSTIGAFIADQGGVRKVLDSNYPPLTVRGIVVIGGFAYVMDQYGVIHNSALDNIDVWPALNVLGNSYDDSPGQCITKVGNYLVAWTTRSMTVYYDNGNPTGSPLSPYTGATVKIGCYAGNTLVNVDKNVIWLGQDSEGVRQVYMLDGLTPKVISTPSIDRLLAQGLIPASYSGQYVTYAGHVFYLLTLGSFVQITFCYDVITGIWTRWAGSPNCPVIGGLGPGTAPFNGLTFNLFGCASNLSNSGQNSYFIDSTSQVGSLGGLFTDYGAAYWVVIQTAKFDGGNNYKKFWGPLEVIGDYNVGTPTIFYTDDDYNTWSAGRTVNMAQSRPILYRNGSSRRRAITYCQVDANPMGLEYFEFPQVEQGGDAGG